MKIQQAKLYGKKKLTSSPTPELDTAVLRTVDKLPQYIRYIEKEYGIAVLDRTKKRRA